MGAMASQITSLTIVYSTVYWGANERQQQSSTPLAFVRGIHRSPVNSPHKGPVTRKMVPFDDVIMLRSEQNDWNFEDGIFNSFFYITKRPNDNLFHNKMIKTIVIECAISWNIIENNM